MKLNVLGFSASSTDRVMACVGSVIIPDTNSVAEDVAENPAARGIAVHAFLCDCAVIGRDRALAQVRAEFRDQCMAIDTDRLPTLEKDAYAGEVALAYDVKRQGPGHRLRHRPRVRKARALGDWRHHRLARPR